MSFHLYTRPLEEEKNTRTKNYVGHGKRQHATIARSEKTELGYTRPLEKEKNTRTKNFIGHGKRQHAIVEREKHKELGYIQKRTWGGRKAHREIEVN